MREKISGSSKISRISEISEMSKINGISENSKMSEVSKIGKIGIITKIRNRRNRLNKLNRNKKNRIKRKNKIRSCLKFLIRKVCYPFFYSFCSHKPVDENKVIFVEVRLKEISNSFELLYRRLKKDDTYKIKVHFLLEISVNRVEYVIRCFRLLKDMADAKVVFINDSVPVLNTITLRKETKLIQVWHGCGAFKKFGYSTAELLFGDSKSELEKYPLHRNYSLVTVSSPMAVPAFTEAMGLERQRDVIKPIGVSRSDRYFQPKFHKKAREKLGKLMPAAKQKKVILYAPTFRGSVAEAKTPDVLDIAMFSEELGAEYVLLIKHHPLVKQLPQIERGKEAFCMDMTSKMSIEELLCVSDICISDYSSLVFEYSLLERPMLFFPYDIEEYFDWRGFYFRYEEFVPGPICKTNRELIEWIKNVEQIDMEVVKKFRERFMSSCDGRATGRILEEVFEMNGLNQYKHGGAEPDAGIERESLLL